MPTLLRRGNFMGSSIARVEVTLHEYNLGDNAMRVVFTVELKVDVDANDDERRKAFIDLAIQHAEQMYGTAAMLAKKPPIITASRTDREGKTTLPLFAAATTLPE